MTTLALTFPNFAPAVQDDVRVGYFIRRVLTWSLILTGALLTLWVLSQLGPVVYGLPVPLVRRGLATPEVTAA
jgi:hypothetical protein